MKSHYWSARFGKAKYENGAVFEGEFEADKRQGWGTQVFPDESVYVGEWAEDKMTGLPSPPPPPSPLSS
jgi:hypothetical protein